MKIPINTSKQLPSRGMVMIKGTMNGISYITPLEPDGKEGHWFELSETLMMGTGCYGRTDYVLPYRTNE